MLSIDCVIYHTWIALVNQGVSVIIHMPLDLFTLSVFGIPFAMVSVCVSLESERSALAFRLLLETQRAAV